MRLTCPNCSALYEVPEANLPSGGIAVQCSACLFNWFHTPPLTLNQNGNKKQDLDSPARKKDSTFDEFGIEAAKNIDRQGIVDKEISDTINNDISPQHAGQKEVIDRALPKRRLHPTVAEVLKEEAKREALARAGKTAQIESTPSMIETLIGEHQKSSTATENSNEEMMDSDYQDIRKVLQDKTSEQPQKILEKSNEKNEKELLAVQQSIESKKLKDKNFAITKAPKGRAKRLGFYTGVLFCLLAIAVFYSATEIKHLFPVLEQSIDLYVNLVNDLLLASEKYVSSTLIWLESLRHEYFGNLEGKSVD